MARGAAILVSLDHIDRAIVAALQAAGRRPFSSIADELGISESVVRYRVQRLERAEILQVVGIADPLKIGFDLMAMIGIKVETGKIGTVSASSQFVARDQLRCLDRRPIRCARRDRVSRHRVLPVAVDQQGPVDRRRHLD